MVRFPSLAIVLVSAFYSVGAAAEPSAIGLPEGSPGQQGFSAARLQRVPALLQREIETHHYAGAVWLVARNGQAVSHGAVGWSNLETHTAMSEATLFRICSMTKLITTVTALTLLEEGRINLDDPVERYLPAMAHRMVLVGGTADAPRLEAAESSITIRELLTQSSGLTYDFFAPQPLRALWKKADLWHSASLQDFVARAATLPLAHQPGARWTYGINTDVLGAVIEAVTQRDLESVMRERVLDPLGMAHTTFRQPDHSADLATIYRRSAGGGLERDDEWNFVTQQKFCSGGGGLYSTLHDYARFSQMLLNGGELDGVRILGRKTVEAMTSNQIGRLPLPAEPFSPPGFGFGVRVQLPTTPTGVALGSPGTFGWDGIATTYVSIDPRERMVTILLLQHGTYNEGHIFERFANSSYQALGN